MGDKGLENAFAAMRPAAAWPACAAYKLRKLQTELSLVNAFTFVFSDFTIREPWTPTRWRGL